MDDKISGCLAGIAVGDSLGANHEFFFQRNNVYTGILYLAPEYHFKYSHWKSVVGSFTDDTEMTICNTRAIIESKGVYNRELTIKKYQEWAACSKSMGRNTRKLFKGVKTLKGYQKRYDQIYKDTDENTWTQSNGSLMRAGILSFFGEDIVVEDCKITNPHPINIDSSRLYCYLIRCCAKDVPTKKIKKGIEEMDLHDDVRKTYEEACADAKKGKSSRDVTGKNKGWVLHGLYAACYAWLTATSYENTIDEIIRWSGDTDTNAAIAGAVLGAKFGFEKISLEDRTSSNIFTVLVHDPSEGDNPRPSWLLLTDFFDIVKQLDKLIDL